MSRLCRDGGSSIYLALCAIVTMDTADLRFARSSLSLHKEPEASAKKPPRKSGAVLHFISVFYLMISVPIKPRSASGTVTEPSAF